MNLTKTPSMKDLATLLAAADDNAAHHVLWVDTKGEVHLDREEDFDDDNPQIRFRYESFGMGNEYTGPKAAADDEHVKDLLQNLLDDWTAGKTGFVDD